MIEISQGSSSNRNSSALTSCFLDQSTNKSVGCLVLGPSENEESCHATGVLQVQLLKTQWTCSAKTSDSEESTQCAGGCEIGAESGAETSEDWIEERESVDVFPA